MILKRIYSLVGPGGVLVVAAALLLRRGESETVTALLRIFPYAVLAAGVLLGWRFHRTGVVFALLALADQALQHFAAGEGAATGVGRTVFHAVALLVPLTLAGFSLLSERGAVAERLLLGSGILAGQALVVLALAGLAPAGDAELWEHAFIQGYLADWTPVSQPALVGFLLALGLLMARCLLNRRALDNGFLWATVAAFLAVHSFGFTLRSLGEGGEALLRSSSFGGQAATLYFSTAGLILAVAVVEASYALAYRDELTRLPGRRALNEALGRMGQDYAIAMVDVDHFKKFNDTYGHEVGDQVLQMVAARLEQVGGGGAFRYGGEEFSILFPGKTVEEALPHLEEVRETVAASKFTLRGPGRPRKKPKKPRPASPRKQVSVTVSIGVAQPEARHPAPREVIQAADQALYRAKKAGRNRVKT